MCQYFVILLDCMELIVLTFKKSTNLNVRRLVYFANLQLLLMEILHKNVPIILIHIMVTCVKAQHIPQIQKLH